jgi:hypothetical protein
MAGDIGEGWHLGHIEDIEHQCGVAAGLPPLVGRSYDFPRRANVLDRSEAGVKATSAECETREEAWT